MDSNIYVTVSSVEVGVVIQEGAVIDTEITAVGPQGIPGEVNVLDNLTSTSVVDALSANQGRVLDGKITTVSTDLDTLEGKMAPLIATGGFYALVDFNSFKTTDRLLSVGTVVPLVKIRGGISVASNTMTLVKGYAYEFVLDYELVEGAGSGAFILNVYNAENGAIVSDWGNKKYSVNYNHTTHGTTGFALIDLTSASSDMSIQIKCSGVAGSPSVASQNGGCTVKKFKKVTV